MTRLFYDCEFIDTGERIHLVSIGIVRDDGVTYYAEPDDTPIDESSDWVRANVLPYTAQFGPDDSDGIIKSRSQIADDLRRFAGPSPRWYGYVDHYDWVLLSQLYGPLVVRPANWPYGSVNLAVLADLADIDPEDAQVMPAENEMPGWEHLSPYAHHAMPGALWTKRLWARIQQAASDDVELTALVGA